MFGGLADGEVGADAEDLAEVARGDVVADGDGEGEEAGPDCFHEEEVLFLGCFVEDLGLLGVDGEGFFAEDGFAGGEAEPDVLVVVRVGGCDVDHVDVWVFDEVRV